MTRNARIKSIVRSVKYRPKQTGGRAKQTAGKATGTDSLRRKGKAEERKSRLNQFASKIRTAPAMVAHHGGRSGRAGRSEDTR
jgi:uncharacterized protein YjbJ (UPF0337 family)